ncbi:MAG: M48 family metallopeptidase [Hyphomonadaceae bacterium]
MTRIFAMAFAASMLLAGAAAAVEPAFDPEQATQAWLATMGEAATARSNAYFQGGYIIEYASTLLSILIAGLLLFSGWARGVTRWLERTVKWFPLVALGSSAFVLLVSTLLTMPFSYYVGFIREHRYGLSTQTFAGWLNEALIGAALSIVLGAIFLAILYVIIRAAKKTWWIWGAAVSVALAAVLIMAAPVYISPLFNSYTPMEQSELRDDILGMAQAHGVPADNVYVYDRSRQTNSISANVQGFAGTTRISLADTLLERASPEGVRAVMGHELGHYVLGHIYSLLAFSAGLIVFTFAGVHFGFRALAKNERWGIRDIADPAGLPLIFGIIAVIGVITTPMQNNITRFHENQADAFGLAVAREPDGFAEAAMLLSEYRKMEPSLLEEIVFYTHPSGWQRVHRAMTWKANEIAMGRAPASPGGPPPGWRPDFVVMSARPEAAPSAAPSPGAE